MPRSADPKHLPDYTYGALPATESIRVLVLQPGSYGSPIVCELEFRVPSTEASSKPQKYEALTYTWGDEQKTEYIRIGEKSGKRLPVMPNLLNALRRIRSESKERRLWIDAVCINQGNEDEKNAQVSMMYSIYTGADGVLIWLGEAANDSDLALDFVSEVVDIKNFEHLVEHRPVTRKWEALHNIMKRPWFTRRWIVQEIALARKATVHCGGKEVDWRCFRDAITLFRIRSRRISKTMRGLEEYGNHPDYISDIQGLGASQLVDATSNLFRRAADGRIVAPLKDLTTLVQTLTPFKSGNRHDTIYAVLSLANDAVPRRPGATSLDAAPTWTAADRKRLGPILKIWMDRIHNTKYHYSVDYKKGFFEVCKDFLEWALKNSGSLDILCFPWAPPCETGEEECPDFSRATRDTWEENYESDTTDSNNVQRNPRKRKKTRISRRALRSQATAHVANTEANGTTQAIDHPRKRQRASSRSTIAGAEASGAEPKPLTDMADRLLHPHTALPLANTDGIVEADNISRDDTPSPNVETLPSWIPIIPGDIFGQTKSGRYERVRADPLLGSAGTYRASGKTSPVYKFNKPNANNLRVGGFAVTAISSRSIPATGGQVPPEWLSFIGWDDRNADPPDRLWRTLVVDRAPGGGNTPDYYARVFSYIVGQSPVNRSINPQGLLNKGLPEIAEEYIKRMESVIYGRILIKAWDRVRDVTTAGLAPAGAKEGDLICILLGCRAPVILRAINKASADTHYKLIGPCYVHGMMEGEAMPNHEEQVDQLSNKLPPKWTDENGNCPTWDALTHLAPYERTSFVLE